LRGSHKHGKWLLTIRADYQIYHKVEDEMEPEEANNKLCEAALHGRMTDAQAAIRAGADVNGKDTWGMGYTPMQWAAQFNRVELAKCLLDNGAKVDGSDESPVTPLQVASQWGRTEVAKWLIAKGADVNAKRSGFTPLHAAAGNGYTDLARLLIAKRAEVNARTEQGHTPLHSAAGNGHADVARLLIDNGADIDAKDNAGHTPWEWAIAAKKDRVVQACFNAAGNGHTGLVKEQRNGGRGVGR
jgi:ankyrin repeat protein